MRDKLKKAVAKAQELHEVKKIVTELLESIKVENEMQRIGYVAGIITSDGNEHIERNIKKLIEHTENLRNQHDFPIFSAPDVITPEVFERIDAINIPSKTWQEFWRDLLTTGHITDIFMSPRWEKSNGAIDEHETAKRLNIKIHYI